MSKPYRYGDKITRAEFDAVLAMFCPDPAKRPSDPNVKEIMQHIYKFSPNRLVHEINRLRRWAFDSGEEGFSHEVL